MSKVTWKPLGTRKACADLKRDTREAPVTQGQCGLGMKSAQNSRAEQRATLAVGLPVHQSAISVLKKLSSPRTRKESPAYPVPR